MDVKENMEDIQTILQKELVVYKKILFLLKKEKKAIASLSLEELIKLNKEKENLLLEIKILEESRNEVLDRIATKLNIAKEDLTLSKLVSTLDFSQTKKLKILQEELISIASSIQTINNTNSLLLKESIQFVQNSISFLRSFISSELYLNTGKLVSCRGGGNILNSKV